MSTVTEILYKVGDIVHVTRDVSPTHYGTYKVEKVNPTTYKLRSVDNALRSLRAGHSLVNLGSLPPQEAYTPGTVVPANLAHALSINVGTVVNIVKGVRGATPDDLYVVTGETGRGYRLFLLGGNHGGRYYTSIPATHLRVVESITDWKA